MVTITIEGNRKEVEAIRRLIEEYTLVAASKREKPFFQSQGDTRDTLKIKTPDEFFGTCE